MLGKTFFCFCFILSNVVFCNFAMSEGIKPEALFGPGETSGYRISPDGRYIAYITHLERTDIATIYDLDEKKQTFSFQMGDNHFVGYLSWVNNTRLVLRPAIKNQKDEATYWQRKLQAFDYDGSNNTMIFGFDNEATHLKRNVGMYHFYIENIMLDDPEHIMLATYDSKESTRQLVKVNIYNSRAYPDERSSAEQANFIVDRSGKAIAQTGWKSTNDFELLYLKNDKWVKLENANDYSLMGYRKNGNLILQKDLGENKFQLIDFNRQTQKETVLAELSEFEFDSTLKTPDGELIGYSTENDRGDRFYFDPESSEAKFNHELAKLFKNRRTGAISSSLDGKRKIVRVSGDTEPGMYLLYKDNKLTLLGKLRNKVDRKQLAAMTPIEFKSRDGLDIHAYLSQPKGATGPQPMVLLVHGGPFGVRDYWGYDSEVQLLTSNGFSVLQVNYRGSGGYGLDFESAGHQEWGGKMQDDLTDATLWAIEKGYAKKDKICIFGHSYGGYASLMGVVKEPELYQCAVGSMGVYDLPLENNRGDINDTGAGRAFLADTRGTDKKKLIAASPAYNVEKIKAKLLLAHGTLDNRVPIEHLESLTAALDKNKIPYEKMIFKGEHHGYQNYDNKYAFYNKLITFLKNNIGG